MLLISVFAHSIWVRAKTHAAYRKSTPARPSQVTEHSPLLIAKHKNNARYLRRSYSRATRSSRSSRHHTPIGNGPPSLARAQSTDPWVVRRLAERGRRKLHRSGTLDRAYTRSRSASESQDEASAKTDMESTTESLARGRRRERHLAPFEEQLKPHEMPDGQHGGPSAAQIPQPKRNRLFVPRPSTTRRGSSMVLLGVGALFTFAHIPQRNHELVRTNTPTVVLNHNTTVWNATTALHDTSLTAAPRHPLMLYIPVDTFHVRRWERGRPQMASGQLIGRISAWLCTLLYMTSRMPQIWTNFQRRSVQGLSLFLFVSAFLANLLYSVSILSKPKAVGPERHGFLMESLPFLLGSGGTLLFDLVIITQWVMWHKRSTLAHANAPAQP